MAAIVRLERERLWAGAAYHVVDAWTRFLRDPYHRLFDSQYGCGELMCCPDPIELHSIIETITRALPKSDARTLRQRLSILDDQW
ncbi:hypothetical protein [Dactylosporangium sp. NPDC048998]|uniref:hypothetical protein n=1 Tax=Dactylosporangium sp. NPDC048998 TaxID=3363976 RepID=UPI003712EE67